MNLVNENWFWPLFLGFLLWLGFSIWTLRKDRRELELLGRHHLVMTPVLAFVRRIFKAGLLLGCLFLLGLGSARLQGKLSPQDASSRGIDIMIVLDVSKSMLTRDMAPNRLGAAKKAILSWIQTRPGDRMGVVLFAGESLVQVPLTLDLQAVSQVLENDRVDEVSRGGTDIGKGIKSALEALFKEGQEKRGKAILLITDGELTQGASDVSRVCAEAKEKKVPVVAVGVGTRQGRPIPDGVALWGEALYKKDRRGRTVISRLDEETLRKIANGTGGVFLHGDDEAGFKSIGKAFDHLEETELKEKGVSRRKELSPLTGVLAAGMLLLATVL
jgi:Ca-activated chloride channel homolog